MSTMTKLQNARPNFKKPTSFQIKDPYKIAINMLPLSGAAKRVLLYLLNIYSPFLSNNIFPEKEKVARDLDLSLSYVKDIFRILIRGGWLVAFNTYKEVDGKKKQISNRYKLAATIRSHGTPEYESTLEAVLKHQAENVRPSVAMSNGMSPHEAFKTCKGYDVIDPSKKRTKPTLVEQSKATTIPLTGLPEQPLILKYINPKKIIEPIVHNPSYIKKTSIKGGFNNYIPIITEMYNWLKPIHERFDLLLGITTSEEQRRKQAGILTSRCRDGKGGLCEEKKLYHSKGFTRAMNAIQSCPTILHSEEKSLGRLYDWLDLERAARAQNYEIHGKQELMGYDLISSVESLGVYSVEKGANPEKVVEQVLGQRAINEYLAFSKDQESNEDVTEVIDTKEPVKGEDMHETIRTEPDNHDYLRREDFLTPEEEANELRAKMAAERGYEDLPTISEDVPKAKFNLSQAISQFCYNTVPTPTVQAPPDKSKRELAINAVVAHLTRLGAPSYEPKLRAMLEASDLHYIMSLYDNPSMIIVELTKLMKKSA